VTGERFDPITWWEFDPEERPVPLAADAAGEAADEADLIVNAERETIREDPESTIVTLAELSGDQEGVVPRTSPVSKPAVVVAALILLAGCAGTFTLGWHQGKAALATRERAAGEAAPVTHITLDGTSSTSLNDSDAIKTGSRKGGRG